MAFPSTPVLDSFTRSDAVTLGDNWAANVLENHPTFHVVSNEAAGPNAFQSSYWDGAQFQDAEAYLTVTQMIESSQFRVVARLVNPNDDDAVDYYSVNADTTNSYITKTVNGVLTQLGDNLNVAFDVGDGIGISVVGDTITAYRKEGSGAWAEIASRTDSDIAGAGYIGVLVSNDTSFQFDDFGGGDPTPALGGSGSGGSMYGYYYQGRR